MLNSVFANDIRQTMDHFRRSVDQLFENVSGYPTERSTPSGEESAGWSFSPVIETGWDDHALHLRAVVPGVLDKDVNVNLQGNQLTISGERKAPEGFRRNAYTQLAYGKFNTALALPNGLNLEKVSCQLHDGFLDIQIPMAEAMKPRQIPVAAGEGKKALSA